MHADQDGDGCVKSRSPDTCSPLQNPAETPQHNANDHANPAVKAASSKEVDAAPLSLMLDLPPDLQALPNDVAVTRLSAAASEDMVRDGSCNDMVRDDSCNEIYTGKYSLVMD